jgi:hypothetical protein
VHISFVAEPPPDATQLSHFLEQGRFAVAAPIAAEGTPPPGQETGLDILQLVGDATPPGDCERQAKTWLFGAAGVLDVKVQSDRILWHPERAAIIAAADRLDDYVRALIHFGFYERELRRLEAQIEDWWRAARGHIPLTHQVDRAAVRRWAEVNRATEATTTARMRFADIRQPLGTPSPSLSGPAQRLVSELLRQTRIEDRL